LKNSNNSLIELIRKFALKNAIQYNGKAKVGPVMGKIFSIKPDLKLKTEFVEKEVTKIVKEVNALSEKEQREVITENWPELLQPEKRKSDEKLLPPLPNANKFTLIHTRFCPNPDGALHIGGARAAILCDEYAKKYSGKLTLRFDDTDPRTKSPIPEAYEWIRKDLEWLDIKWHDEVYQSDRMRIYYDCTEKLLSLNAAYICDCDPVHFRKLLVRKESCPCRGMPCEEHLSRWQRMLNGQYNEGDVVVRIKTDLNHPNPAVRDWPALRIINTEKYPHPRTGDKYRVWPLFAFCGGIDDHYLKISHILRGKEHLTNTTRQLYLFDYLGWDYPESIHYGRLKIAGSILSKSKIRESIEKGDFTDWADPRLGTLMAIRQRGISPETIREIMISVGPKPVDATLSWENIYAINRKILDPSVKRYFVIINPIKLSITDLEKNLYVSKPLFIPGHPDKGHRTLQVKAENGRALLYIQRKDLKILEIDQIVRLMELFNIKINKVGSECVEALFHSEPHLQAKILNAPLIHWLPQEENIPVKIVTPKARILTGIGETGLIKEKVNSVIQMERFGFGKINTKTQKYIRIYYAHR